MKVYMAEKKEVGEAIVVALGDSESSVGARGYIKLSNGDVVTWASGHLLALSDPEDHDSKYKKWDLNDIPMSWPVSMKKGQRSEQLKVVTTLFKGAHEIINCADPDEAGQRIFDEIIQSMKLPAKVKITRALINDNNPVKMKRDIDNRKDNALFLGMSQNYLARSVADQRVGFNFTRLMTLLAQLEGANIKLNVGRVLSCILGLVVRRERVRNDHTTVFYEVINGVFKTGVGELKGVLKPKEEYGLALDDKDRFESESEAKLLAQKLNFKSAYLTSIKRKRTEDSPPLPFDLLSLQIEVSRLFGISPSETMTITQALRTEFSAITYNRCDTRFYTDEKFDEAPEIIEQLSRIPDLAGPISILDLKIKSRAFDTSKTTAHHALMPTGNVDGLDKMNQRQKAVYFLIVRNFLMQFMRKQEKEITEYIISITDDNSGQKYDFTGKSKRITYLGWGVMLKNDLEAEGMEETEGLDTTSLIQGEVFNESAIESVSQKTNPPASYVMETLLKDLQNSAKYASTPELKQLMLDKDKDNKGEFGGIGTSATRDGMLERLFAFNFIYQQKPASGKGKAKILPTETGYVIHDLLPKSLVSPDTTAIWSHKQQLIQDGELTCESFWSEVDEFINIEVANLKSTGLKIPQRIIDANPISNVRNNSDCPACGCEVKQIKGKYGLFWVCDDCEERFPDLAGKPFYRFCDCGELIKIVKPKDKNKKQFLACSSSECKHVESL